MYNRIWFWGNRMKARIKDALSMKLTPWEEFLIEIGLD